MCVVLSAAEALDVANGILSASRAEDARLEKVHTYLRGTYQTKELIPSRPANARAHREYLAILERSKQPVLSLIPDQMSQQLKVVGYRPARVAENAPGWARWQANRMDARQGGLHRSVVTYGAAYNIILPGTPVPVWRQVSPRRGRAMFSDSAADEWPVYFLEEWVEGTKVGPRRRFRLIDDEHVYELAASDMVQSAPREAWVGQPLARGGIVAEVIGSPSAHGAGLCPVVRYVGPFDLDGEYLGEIDPLITLQDQADASTFYVEMAERYAIHRQKWVSGMGIDEDDDGNPIPPFNVAIDQLLVAEDPDTKFGEFSQTQIGDWLEARKEARRVIAIKSQVPPGYLLGDIPANLSAEAVTATETPGLRRGGDYRTSLGESHEQSFRLDAKLAGDMAGWMDTSAQVVWDDPSSRSLSQLADALGKLATQLGIPAEALWEMIPNVTDQDIERWRTMRESDSQRQANAAAAAIGLGVTDDATA